ncbi:MAG: YjfB family protein [Spirochaetia bacterium]
MDIAQLATGMKQAEVLQQAAVQVQKMSLDNAEVQAQGLTKLMDSAQVIQDAALGNNIDTSA